MSGDAPYRTHHFALVKDTDHCAICGHGRFAIWHSPLPVPESATPASSVDVEPSR